MTVVIIRPPMNAITILPRIGLKSRFSFLILLSLPLFWLLLLLLPLCPPSNHQWYQSRLFAPSSLLIALLASEKFLSIPKHVSNCFLALSYLFSLVYNIATSKYALANLGFDFIASR